MKIARIRYWIEKLLSLIIAIILVFLTFKNWNSVSILISSGFYDKIITITSTLFGFLLAILTLIIQSDSETIKKMKKHGSYARLIKLNKKIVLLSIICCLFSFSLATIPQELSSSNPQVFKILAITNIFLLTIILIDTFLFVLIFYKILLNNS